MEQVSPGRLYRILLVATITMIGGGTIIYHFLEGWSFVNSYYFCVVTLATVGYGDFTPHTTLGKLFTTVYILVGIGIIGAFLRVFLSTRGKKFMDKHPDEFKVKRKQLDRNNSQRDDNS